VLDVVVLDIIHLDITDQMYLYSICRRVMSNLYLAVWDMTSGRMGTLQIMLDVTKPPKRAKTGVEAGFVGRFLDYR
jgi:hypothetical protein